MEFICGILATVCLMLAIMLIAEKRKQPKAIRKEESAAKEEKGENGETLWEVTRTKRPTREQQYINMLMYNGENQIEGGRSE